MKKNSNQWDASLELPCSSRKKKLLWMRKQIAIMMVSKAFTVFIYFILASMIKALQEIQEFFMWSTQTGETGSDKKKNYCNTRSKYLKYFLHTSFDVFINTGWSVSIWSSTVTCTYLQTQLTLRDPPLTDFCLFKGGDNMSI